MVREAAMRGWSWLGDRESGLHFKKEGFDYVVGFVDTDIAFKRTLSDVYYRHSRANKPAMEAKYNAHCHPQHTLRRIILRSKRLGYSARLVQPLAEKFQHLFVVSCCCRRRRLLQQQRDVEIGSTVREKTTEKRV